MAARQIAKDVGAMKPEDADRPFGYEIFCIGDMGSGKAFYIRSDTWFGGKTEVMEFGRVPYQLKMMYRNLFFMQHGRVPDIGLNVAQFMAERIHI
jgi:sulfide:quinone oxidoreductase